MKKLVALCLLVCMILLTPIVVGAEEIPRVVTITILLDRDDQNRETLPFMGNAIYSTTRLFKKEFGIQLMVINMKSWILDSDNFDAEKELAKLISAGRSSDLVVAFTTKSFFRNEAVDIDGESMVVEKKLGGIANNVPGNYAILSLEEKSDLILTHELGHLFGADHSPENSVMNGSGVNSLNFDAKNKEVIRANRNRQF